MDEVIEYVIDALAAFRLTRLLTKDGILLEPRVAIIRAAYRHAGRPGEPPGDTASYAQRYAEDDPNVPKLAELVVCRWCCGMWISAAVVVARRIAPDAWRIAARVLAGSALAALIAGLEQG